MGLCGIHAHKFKSAIQWFQNIDVPYLKTFIVKEFYCGLVAIN